MTGIAPRSNGHERDVTKMPSRLTPEREEELRLLLAFDFNLDTPSDKHFDIDEMMQLERDLHMMLGEITTLRQQLAEAKTDAGRVEKLERIIADSDGGTLSMGGVCYCGVELKVPGKRVERIGSGDDLRDAIDNIPAAPATPEPTNGR
jgi:hypothetical protein